MTQIKDEEPSEQVTTQEPVFEPAADTLDEQPAE
jgi:hypothetical protein